MPKVSICLPTYNHPDLVKRALHSIFIQNYSDYEIVITDDSDSNVIKDLVANFNDSRMRYHKNVNRLGSPENWNRAISLSMGEFIKILHHDDWFPNESCLNKFVKLLEDNPTSIIGFSSTQASRHGMASCFIHSPSLKQLKNLQTVPSYLFFDNFIGGPSATIFRKSEKIYFDKSFKWVVDIDFYIQLLNQPDMQYSYIDQPLICVTTDGAHQITNECAGNENVEPFEYISLFNKIRLNHPKPNAYEFVIFFSKLFRRFKVDSIDKLRQLGRINKIPFALRLSLWIAAGLLYCQSGKRRIDALFSNFRK